MEQPAGLLKVYFPDNSWTTLPILQATTAQQVCAAIVRKRHVTQSSLTSAPENGLSPRSTEAVNAFALYVSDTNGDRLFERRLDPVELPFSIQEASREQGQLDHIKFVFKSNIAAAKAEEDTDPVSSDSETDEMFSHDARIGEYVRSGYLQKKGKHNTAWRDRWCALQDSKLFYFKSHKSPSPIAFIPLHDAVVRESSGRLPSEFLFEVVTKDRLYELKAPTHVDMTTWIQTLQRMSLLEVENEELDDIQYLIDELEYVRADTEDQIVQQWTSMENLLEHSTSREEFLHYAHNQHCDESILFWMDAEAYRQLPPARDPQSASEHGKRAMEIFETYMKENAVKEVCIDRASRNAILSALQSADGDPNHEAFVSFQRALLLQVTDTTVRNFLGSHRFVRAKASVTVSDSDLVKCERWNVLTLDPTKLNSHHASARASAPPQTRTVRRESVPSPGFFSKSTQSSNSPSEPVSLASSSSTAAPASVAARSQSPRQVNFTLPAQKNGTVPRSKRERGLFDSDDSEFSSSIMTPLPSLPHTLASPRTDLMEEEAMFSNPSPQTPRSGRIPGAKTQPLALASSENVDDLIASTEALFAKHKVHSPELQPSVPTVDVSVASSQLPPSSSSPSLEELVSPSAVDEEHSTFARERRGSDSLDTETDSASDGEDDTERATTTDVSESDGTTTTSSVVIRSTSAQALSQNSTARSPSPNTTVEASVGSIKRVSTPPPSSTRHSRASATSPPPAAIHRVPSSPSLESSTPAPSLPAVTATASPVPSNNSSKSTGISRTMTSHRDRTEHTSPPAPPPKARPQPPAQSSQQGFSLFSFLFGSSSSPPQPALPRSPHLNHPPSPTNSHPSASTSPSRAANIPNGPSMSPPTVPSRVVASAAPTSPIIPQSTPTPLPVSVTTAKSGLSMEDDMLFPSAATSTTATTTTAAKASPAPLPDSEPPLFPDAPASPTVDNTAPKWKSKSLFDADDGDDSTAAYAVDSQLFKKSAVASEEDEEDGPLFGSKRGGKPLF